MTVTYTSEVASERFGGFFRLLFRWRGSIYSVLYGEITIFVVLYAFLSILYRHILNPVQKHAFERLCLYFGQFADYVPVTFVVGFYVIRIIARRWTQWENIPWPDRFAFDISAYIEGSDFKTRMLRRTLVRYANLASVLCFCDICMAVKRRFPTLDHLIVAGLMTHPEKELYLKTCSTKDSNWYIPYHWAYTLLHRANKEIKLADGHMRLQDDVLDLKNRCWVLFSHDWIQIPMVYTQVATLSVYLFMFSSLFGRQYLDVQNKGGTSGVYKIDLYVPIMTILQIMFYLGWLKVGEVLISPMGVDADDFDINYIIDRNLNLSYSVVDYNYNRLPPLEKDLHWDSEEPNLPHTFESQGVRDQPFKGSAFEQAEKEEEKEKDGKLSEFTTSSNYGGIDGSVAKASQSSYTRSMSSRPAFLRSITRLLSRSGGTPTPSPRPATLDNSTSPILQHENSALTDDEHLDPQKFDVSRDQNIPLLKKHSAAENARRRLISTSRPPAGPSLMSINENATEEMSIDLTDILPDQSPTTTPTSSPTLRHVQTTIAAPTDPLAVTYQPENGPDRLTRST